jgi:hypothetical protein
VPAHHLRPRLVFDRELALQLLVLGDRHFMFEDGGDDAGEPASEARRFR